MKRATGFTLIELLIAVAIFAFLVALAGPWYSQMNGNFQVRTSGEAILNGVRLAQAQALKNNLPAVFTLNAATGWVVQVDDPENVGQTLFKQTWAKSDGGAAVTITPSPGGTTEVTFDGLGRIIPNTDASASLQLVDLSNNAGNRPLRVIVNNTVNATKLCDPDVNLPANDPQGCN